MRSKLFATAAVFALSFPVVAAAQDATEDATAQGQDVAQQCLQDLQVFNNEIGEAGYGLAGPRGYGVTGTGVTAPGVTPYAYDGRPATPRGEMRALTNAAYILAMNGSREGCETILAEMRDLYERRRQQFAEGEPVPAEELATWRSEWLAAAVPVTELEGTIQIENIIGSDVRSAQDEDLGDVEDVVLNVDGGIEYALISRGGFLGLGGELVPVPWEDLRVTPEPYRDTLVLPVQETAVENAPSAEGNVTELLATEEWRQQVDEFWTSQIEE